MFEVVVIFLRAFFVVLFSYTCSVEAQNLLSSHSRLIARSVGSLHSHDSVDSGSGESGNIRLNQKVSSRLARTMENLKKAR